MRARQSVLLSFALATVGLLIPTARAAFDPAKMDKEAPAVAAHFPDPDVSYDTPAFAPGKQDFTSHAEMMAYVAQLQARAPQMQVRILDRSHEGREIPLLAFSRSGSANPSRLLQDGRPSVLVIALQHGNEPASGDAALALAKRLAEGDLQDVLDRINVLIVPRANPDGAEAFTRDAASKTDLNRDHLLLQTPEVRALARVAREYLPAVVMDTHEFTVLGRWVTKFNAVQRYDGLVQYATIANLPAALTEAAETWFRQPLLDDLAKESLTAFWYYTTSAEDPEDKKVSMGGVQPNTGRNVTGLRNSISFLLEVRGVGLGRAHLKRRVRTSELAMASIVRRAYDHADGLKELVRAAGEEVSRMACKGELVVEGGQTPGKKELEFLDAGTGEPKTITVDWNDALTVQPRQVRSRPCGYAIDVSQTLAIERLQELGVTVHTLAAPTTLQAERYVIEAAEGGQRQDVRGAIVSEEGIIKLKVRTEGAARELPAGTHYVSLAQPLGNLVAAAMEPDAENSYAANHLLKPDAGLGLLRVMEPPAAPMFLQPFIKP